VLTALLRLDSFYRHLGQPFIGIRRFPRDCHPVREEQFPVGRGSREWVTEK
jgi:hypothetical protein